MKTTVDSTALRALLPVPAAAPPSAIHPIAAAATPTAADRPPEPSAGGTRRFAELLRERRSDATTTPRAVAAPVAASATDAAAASDAEDACEASDATETNAPPRPAHPAKARAPIAARATVKAAVEQQTAPTMRDDAARDDDDAALATTTSPPANGEPASTPPLVGVQAPAHCAPGGDASDDGATDAADVAAHAADGAQPIDASTRTTPVRARGMATIDSVDGDRAAARERGAHAAPAAATFASALGETLRVAPAPLDSHTRAEAPLAAVGTANAGVGGAAPRDAATAPTTATLATPIDAPDFAAALGVHVSVLARDGVQHAELHLDPVETGPVSIRIEIDGTNARVDFGADLAATRDAIERGLPELASALRDAGLTLAGGGVSQHAGSRPRGDEGATDGTPAHAAATPVAAAAVSTRAAERRVAAGGVDVYA